MALVASHSLRQNIILNKNHSSLSIIKTNKHIKLKRIIKTYATVDETYKWPTGEIIWQYLTDNNIKSISPNEVQNLIQSQEWILIDVRPKTKFEKAHIKDAFNVPLFDDMDWSKATPLSTIRSFAYFFNGVTPVIPNEEFENDIKQILDDNKKLKGVITYCETGGTLVPSTNFMYGKISRSLKAIYRMHKGNVIKDVNHLDGGIYNWFRDGKPINGNYDGSDAGRTPNVAEPAGGDFFKENDGNK